MKPRNIFDTRADAEAYLKLCGQGFEIVIWTNKAMQRQYSVVRKPRGRRR